MILPVLVSVLLQSKKSYELRCKEADEAEQGAERTTSKNSDKVQQCKWAPLLLTAHQTFLKFERFLTQTSEIFYINLTLCATQDHKMSVVLLITSKFTPCKYKWRNDSANTCSCVAVVCVILSMLSVRQGLALKFCSFFVIARVILYLWWWSW